MEFYVAIIDGGGEGKQRERLIKIDASVIEVMSLVVWYLYLYFPFHHPAIFSKIE